MRIGKVYRFEAAHHLPGNKGKCAAPHGHSYKLEVEISADDLIPTGPSDGGMVMDFEELDNLIKPLLEVLDHSDLNVSARTHLHIDRTTAEFLCLGIGRWFDSVTFSRRVRISRIRLWETDRCYAEWTP